ncbi:hypothetical protein B0I00_1875 [Novosphingobium kunmingense]|uniref:Uncharacterized protein n=1 Tax=Novosphingobium kunmingense TaxID=1211806 RepID=A0A2N0HL25_9SPHN|nr:hypothetical protein [Novosphingobium kunmingense]PKB19636.1 hypothetical protein B0I00_1875 [Novosphingobium kunmingense]
MLDWGVGLVLLGVIAAGWLAFGAVWAALDWLDAAINDEPMPRPRAVLRSLLFWPWANRW